MTVQRRHLFCGLAMMAFANGVSDRVGEALGQDSVLSAAFATFGVSIVVWGALLAAVWLFLHAEREPARNADVAVAVLAAIAFLLPIPPLSWLALTGVAAYLACTVPDGPMRRAAIILGATTVPMFWARLLFAALSGPILAIDANLVSWIVGTQSDRNMIPFADGSGVLFLEPACSSLTNVSLVLLCGVLVVKVYDQPWSAGRIQAVIAACFAAIAINIFRMSLIGVFPAYYDVIHGPVGATLAEWLTIIAVASIYAGGMRTDEPAHA
jgi:exosortase/archaeosortase family protein